MHLDVLKRPKNSPQASLSASAWFLHSKARTGITSEAAGYMHTISEHYMVHAIADMCR